MSTARTGKPDQRHSASHPCPVCGGYDLARRGTGERCFGFISGAYVHCSREEHAGQAPFHNGSETWSHAAEGPCKCGHEHRPAPPKAEPLKRYEVPDGRFTYRDSSGANYMQVRRFEPKGGEDKQFYQYRWDGKQFVAGLKELRTIPYRLDELIAADPELPVFIPEGERKADRLVKWGLVATCNPMGAGKWKDWHSPHLQGRDVVLLADNDEAGRSHVQKIAKSLHGKARSIKIVEFPELPPKGDIIDWLDRGNSIADLRTRVDQAEEWKPEESPITHAVSNSVNGHASHNGNVGSNGHVENGKIDHNPSGFHLTEAGNAQRLVRKYGERIRYCYPWKCWLCWDGTRWVRDYTGQVVRYAKRTVQLIGAEAAKIKDPDTRKEVLRWAIVSESKKAIEAMIFLAQSEEGIAVQPEELDADKWLLNCRNGTVCLQTGRLLEHNRAHLITKICNVAFSPDATCPRWEQFEREIFANDETLIAYIRRVLGYSLTADDSVQEMYILYGDGSNGKNVFTDTFRNLLGDYACIAEPSLLLNGKHESHPTGLADLQGRRFVCASETDSGKRMAEALVKRVTGDAAIKARRMHENFFTFQRTFKVLLATNHRPEITGDDHAIWRRLMLIPFVVKFVPTTQPESLPYVRHQERGLEDRLATEAPGILALMVRSCLEWRRDGMNAPKAVKMATETYRADMDVIGQFLGECCEAVSEILKDKARVKASALYERFSHWAKSGGRAPMDSREFGGTMEKRGFLLKKSNGVCWRYGLQFVSEDGPNPADY